MKRTVASLVLALVALLATPAFAAEPPPAVQGEYTPPTKHDFGAKAEWVQTDTYGWIWVPVTAQAVVVQNRPYAYFYTPSYGWTWYVSPWGAGQYSRGASVHTRFEPHVYDGGRWVAPRHFAAPKHRGHYARRAARRTHHRR